jgi:heptosyltransferase II
MQVNCRYFSGYKPCGRFTKCDSACPEKSIPDERILIIHLEALGAVVRSTALLAAIKRKYPNSHITWITKKPADLLLANLKHIDRILTTSPECILILAALEFDIAMCIDKSLAAAGVLAQTSAKKVFGFIAQKSTGAIMPATQAADELWQIGLSDHKKFFENAKPETQLICEALELPYLRDSYSIALSPNELELALKRRREWSPHGEIVVGLNTGCADAIPYKKLTVEMQREIIKRLQNRQEIRLVLLGGREDTERNREIAKGLNVINSPTENGLRDGFCSVEACDLVITGDSLGMHMAIALKKWVVAWFGPTCAHEIDLFERGVRVLTGAQCSPCWKRSCDKNPMCYDLVDIDSILAAVEKGIQWYNLSFKQLSSATYSSGARS